MGNGIINMITVLTILLFTYVTALPIQDNEVSKIPKRYVEEKHENIEQLNILNPNDNVSHVRVRKQIICLLCTENCPEGQIKAPWGKCVKCEISEKTVKQANACNT